MEDPRWLRLVTIGLVLAALAVGYFLISGKLASNSVSKQNTQISKATPIASAAASVILGQNTQSGRLGTASPTPTPSSAYNRIVNRSQANSQAVQSLPNTGFPFLPAVLFSASALVTGWGLRKFPQ